MLWLPAGRGGHRVPLHARRPLERKCRVQLQGGLRLEERYRCVAGLRMGLAPKCMGLASLGLDIGISCDYLYSIFQLNVILALYFLGLALSRPQGHSGRAR
jgi:hypothetical protein